MNIAFLYQNALIQREVIASLRRLSRVTVITIETGMHPSEAQGARVVELVSQYTCSIVFTVNEWGIDFDGVISTYLNSHGIIHINWSVDDPFYEELIHKIKYRPSPIRFDFVSDKEYLEPMRQRGYNAQFLPLAVDPSIFNPGPDTKKGEIGYEHDVVFVGNSYFRQMDALLEEVPELIDKITPFLGKIINRYLDDVTIPVEAMVEKEMQRISLPAGISYDKAVFMAKHAMGYMGRKRMITDLIKVFPGFNVFGEPGWLQAIPKERLKTAKYYDSLCAVYQKSKIVVDINRMVIRNGFTQRIFDVPACGSFVITTAKQVAEDFFTTEGPDRELVTFKSRKELISGISYYLLHEEERLAIAQRGMKKVLALHTYDHRIAEIFRVLSKNCYGKSHSIS